MICVILGVMNILIKLLIEFILSFFVSYGGAGLIYFISMAFWIGLGKDPLLLEEDQFGVFIWCVFLLWMIVLSVLLVFKKNKNNRKEARTTGKQMPQLTLRKNLIFGIVDLLASPFLWLLLFWASAREGIFFEFISMGLTTPILLLPPAAAWLGIFKN